MMNKTIIKYVTNPLWELGAGRNRLKFLKELEKSQYYSTEKLIEIQNNKLIKLIHHAYNNVPFYNKLFKKLEIKPDFIQTINDLEKLPILTKEIVSKNFKDLQANDIDKYKPTYYSTGGTSGQHFHFYTTQEVFDSHMAAAYRAWKWAGWDFGIKYAYIWGASIDLKNENSIKKKIKNLFTENRLLIQALRFTEQSLKRDVERLVKFRPKIIISYPSTLIILIKYMQKHNIKLNVRGIITSSEKLFAWQRKEIEYYFGCKIFDDYGGRESSIRATQCEKCEGYHISVENGILETVVKGKNVIEKPGKVLLTEFHNYAMPLIRYENTDIATLTNEKCSCGKNLPLIKDIDGRVSDIFVTPDGKYLPAQSIMVAFLDLKCDFYQVIQKTVDRIELNLVKGETFEENNFNKSIDELKKWIGNSIKIDIKFIKDIPETKNGKRRYFFSEVKVDF